MNDKSKMPPGSCSTQGAQLELELTSNAIQLSDSIEHRGQTLEKSERLSLKKPRRTDGVAESMRGFGQECAAVKHATPSTPELSRSKGLPIGKNNGGNPSVDFDEMVGKVATCQLRSGVKAKGVISQSTPSQLILADAVITTSSSEKAQSAPMAIVERSFIGLVLLDQ